MLTLVLLYALVENIIEKPDGIAISAFFILGIIVISLVSRVSRTTELRADHIEFDEAARRFITDSLAHDGQLNLIANRRQAGDKAEYAEKEDAQRGMNPVPGRGRRALPGDRRGRPVGVQRRAARPRRRGRRPPGPARRGPGRAERHRRDPAGPARRHRCPAARYFEWSEGNPLGHLFRYLLLGRGDTAPVVREIIREHEPDPARRPGIHVGG